ncbi:hypothetical protein KAR91_41545 [Candidatus Pacearchaeota archaeon]|nr:hypothetical protein [Candidatus Pacearchaeota archaeon]
MPLYDIKNPYDRATEGYAQAAGTLRGITSGSKSVTTGPGKTAGGAMMSSMGGAAAGASIGASMTAGASVGGWWGAAAGAMAYFLS